MPSTNTESQNQNIAMKQKKKTVSKSKSKKEDKKEEIKSRTKKNNESEDNLSDQEEEEEDDDDEDLDLVADDEIDTLEYHKFLSKLFPSRYINNKIKAGKKIKESEKEESNSDEEEDSEEDDSSFNDEELLKKKGKRGKGKGGKKEKINLFLISTGKKNSKYDDDYEEDDDEDIWEDYDSEFDDSYCDFDSDGISYGTEDENESVSTVSSIITSTSSDEKKGKKKGKKNKDKKDKKEDKKEKKEEKKEKEGEKKEEKKEDKKDKKEENEGEKKEGEKKDTKELIKDLETMIANTKNSTLKTELQECIEKYKKLDEKKDKKTREKNKRIFRKIVSENKSMNDFTFFEKLDVETQRKTIGQLREINNTIIISKPYRMTLLEADIPIHLKGTALKKINTLKYMEPGSGEYYKIKHWVDNFMRIPFGKYENLPLSINDGVEKCHEFMEMSKKTLDEAVYGLNDAKMQIMQMLGQLISNPGALGTAIAIHGPMGTGKTSIVKEGISKILNRPFAFIALGGATDSSFLEGYSYTYEGSTWGQIVQILIESKCMNPVIYFDELDKVSDTPKGDEIIGILTHLTDTTQNSQFHDKYFSEIDFDLSKCLFIFSYNDETKINPILRDRMYRIYTKGYDKKEKTIISQKYLLPKIAQQVNFNEGDIIIPDECIDYIVETYCKEDGVRTLKRCLEIIYTKINLYRLMKPGTNLFEKEMSIQVEFPYKVTKDTIQKLIKKEENIKMDILYSLYV